MDIGATQPQPGIDPHPIFIRGDDFLVLAKELDAEISRVGGCPGISSALFTYNDQAIATMDMAIVDNASVKIVNIIARKI